MRVVIRTAYLTLTVIAILFLPALPANIFSANADVPEGSINIVQYSGTALPLYEEAEALYEEYNKLIEKLETTTGETERQEIIAEIRAKYQHARDNCRKAQEAATALLLDNSAESMEPVWFNDIYGKINRFSRRIINEYAVNVRPIIENTEDGSGGVPNSDKTLTEAELKCNEARGAHKEAAEKAASACSGESDSFDKTICMEARKAAAFAERRFAKLCGM